MAALSRQMFGFPIGTAIIVGLAVWFFTANYYKGKIEEAIASAGTGTGAGAGAGTGSGSGNGAGNGAGNGNG